jgi:hypothetical protein
MKPKIVLPLLIMDSLPESIVKQLNETGVVSPQLCPARTHR